MSNYEYIIASLPYLTRDFRYADGQGFDHVLTEIRDHLSDKDNAVLDLLLKGFDASEADFYREALQHRLPFIRDYFRFDLDLRNAKVRFLNRQLGRPETQDEVTTDPDGIFGMPHEFEEEAKVEAALSEKDLVAREKALDDVSWEKADRLSVFHYFDLTAVLAYVVKLHIANRWLALDEERGKALFRKLVSEVKGTFKGVEAV